MNRARLARMRTQSGTVAQARAMVMQDDEAPAADIGDAETQLLQALIELGETAVGLASGYLYSTDPASIDPEICCFAQNVAVKVSGELTRMQLWLQAPLTTGPDAD